MLVYFWRDRVAGWKEFEGFGEVKGRFEGSDERGLGK